MVWECEAVLCESAAMRLGGADGSAAVSELLLAADPGLALHRRPAKI